MFLKSAVKKRNNLGQNWKQGFYIVDKQYFPKINVFKFYYKIIFLPFWIAEDHRLLGLFYIITLHLLNITL